VPERPCIIFHFLAHGAATLLYPGVSTKIFRKSQCDKSGVLAFQCITYINICRHAYFIPSSVIAFIHVVMYGVQNSLVPLHETFCTKHCLSLSFEKKCISTLTSISCLNA
jgi:hypothetical protein